MIEQTYYKVTKTERTVLQDFISQVNARVPDFGDKFKLHFYNNAVTKGLTFDLYHTYIRFTNWYDILEVRDYVAAYFNLKLSVDPKEIEDLWEELFKKHLFEGKKNDK